MDNKTKLGIEMLRSRGLFFFLILGFISIFTDFGYMGVPVIGFMFIYVVLDILGWEAIHDQSEQAQTAFKIIMGVFLYILTLLLSFRYSPWDGMGFWLLHRFGVFDLVYCWIARELIQDRWDWLGWTPFGFFANKNEQGRKEISKRTMYFQVVCGIFLVGSIYILRYIVDNCRL